MNIKIDKFGPNELEKDEGQSLWELFLEGVSFPSNGVEESIPTGGDATGGDYKYTGCTRLLLSQIKVATSHARCVVAPGLCGPACPPAH